MKQIIKQSEPVRFTQWKANHPEAIYDDLCQVVKKELKQSLIDEQHGLCCYCEKKIDASSSHIEHFRPKGTFADGTAPYAHLQLDYSNLHASCMRVPDGCPETHCGHKKGSDYNTQLISPLAADCDANFEYTIEGKISGATPDGVETIRMLHLDSSLLDADRKSLIEYFENDVEEDELETEVMRHLDSSKSQYGEYFTMVKYLWEKHLL